MAGVSGVSLAALLGGGIFLYSSLTNKSALKVLHSAVTGTSPNSVVGDPSLFSPTDSGSTGSAPAIASQSAVPASSSANMALGQKMATARGWTGTDWTDLVSLWMKESGWSNTADTRRSGAGGDNMSSTVFAYGIAQARPAEKYPLAGQPPDKGGKADPQTQIQWGMDYIAGRYGSPSAAWAHETANNWY